MDKLIPNKTLMKLAAQIVRKSGSKKYKVNGTLITTEEIVEQLIKVSEGFEKGKYQRIKLCKTCGNFSYSGKGGRGCCFPKNFTCSKSSTDFCSGWTPMTAEQKEVRRKVNEHIKSL